MLRFILIIAVIIVAILVGVWFTNVIIEVGECKNLCEESDLDYFKYEPSEKACYCEALAPNIIKMDMNKSMEVSENA